MGVPPVRVAPPSLSCLESCAGGIEKFQEDPRWRATSSSSDHLHGGNGVSHQSGGPASAVCPALPSSMLRRPQWRSVPDAQRRRPADPAR